MLSNIHRSDVDMKDYAKFSNQLMSLGDLTGFSDVGAMAGKLLYHV